MSPKKAWQNYPPLVAIVDPALEERSVSVTISESDDSETGPTIKSNFPSSDSLFIDVSTFYPENGDESTPTPNQPETLVILLNRISEQERQIQLQNDRYPGDLPYQCAMCMVVLSLTLGLMGLLLILSAVMNPSEAEELFSGELSTAYSSFNGSFVELRDN